MNDITEWMAKETPFSNNGKSVKVDIPQVFSDNDVLVKINKRLPKDTPKQTFRSFSFSVVSGNIHFKNRLVSIKLLLEILFKNGLSKTVPTVVTTTYEAENAKIVTEFIDFKPLSYSGPTVWYFRWNGVVCSISGNNCAGGPIFSGTLCIRVHDLTPGIGENIIEQLLTELLEKWTDPVPDKTVVIYSMMKIHGTTRWNVLCNRPQRLMDTIYIDKKIKSQLVNQLEMFYSSSHLYDKYGITWKRVHLFHGPPGGGKTSTVLALASKFNKNICKTTITPDMTGQDIEVLFHTMPDNCVMLLEDVDSLFTERKSETDVDFSTMLNCMDGLSTKRGLVLFMTTNHLTKIDEAFKRPGRVDCCIEFKLAERAELEDALTVLAPQYKHEHQQFLDKYSNVSVATLQKHLFECVMTNNPSILEL